MNNATAALLALVLVCSLPALALAAGGPQASAEAPSTDTTGTSSLEASQHGNGFLELDGTTNRQLLDSGVDIQRAFHQPGTDFATTVAKTDDELRIDYERHAFEQAFEAAEDTDEREALIEAYLDTIDDQIETLHEREQDAVRIHASGDMSDRELLRTLVRNYETADQISFHLLALENDAAQVPGYSIADETRALTNKLDAHRSLLRSDLAGSFTTDNEGSITIETAEPGYRLSMVSNQNYLSEVVRFDHREADGVDQIGSASAATDYAEELYPYAIDESTSITVASISSTNHYRVEVDHQQGSLDAYVDGTTEGVTREFQQLSVAALPIEHEETWTDDGLELTLERTPGHGPALVNVSDAETDEPVEATISIDGEPIGDTDADGTVWIAQPIGPYDIQAVSGVDEVEGTVAD